jgi:predicted PurR-regulated permease PerM
MPSHRTFLSKYTVAAWVLSGVALVLVMQLHLLAALFAGMLVYVLVHAIAPTLSSHLSDQRAKLIAVGLLSALVVLLITAVIVGTIFFFKSDAGSLSALLAKMAEIIESSSSAMPSWIVDEMPRD